MTFFKKGLALYISLFPLLILFIKNEAASSSEDCGDSLSELQRMFPMYDEDSLWDILTQTGSLEAAIGMLSLDWQTFNTFN